MLKLTPNALFAYNYKYSNFIKTFFIDSKNIVLIFTYSKTIEITNNF